MKIPRFSMAAIATALVSQSPYVYSQNLLEEIIVRAQKRDQNLLEVPVSVNVLSGDALANEYVTKIEDITRMTPSLTLIDDDIRVRGVGTGGFALQVEPSVAISVDGVVLARTGQAIINLIDIERIEVLRGPQGTLFGKNASAGLVQVLTRRPAEEFELEGQIEGIEGGEYIAKGTVSTPLTDSMALRISALYENDPGFSDNAALDSETNGRENSLLRARLAFNPNASFDILATAYARKDEYDGADLQWRLVTDPALQDIISGLGVTDDEENSVSTSDGLGYKHIEEFGGSLEINFESESGFQFTSLTAVADWELDQRDDVDEQPIPVREPLFYFDELTSFATYGPANFHQRTEQTIEQVSQEFRLTSPEGQKLTYILGAYGQQYTVDDTLRRDFDFCTSPVLFGLPFFPPNPALMPGDECKDPFFSVASLTDASQIFGMPPALGEPALTVAALEREVTGLNLALFGQGEYQLTDSLSTTFGLRYQYDESDLEFDVTTGNPVPGFGFGEAIASSGETDGTGVSGKLALQYQHSDNTMSYISYARGYKGPTAVFEGGGIVDIDPETSNNYELGLRTSILEGDGYVSATLFLSDYENFQEEQFSGIEQTFILANVGEVQTRGVELETRSRIGTNWTIEASATFVDPTIEEYPGGPCYAPETSDPDCVFTPYPGGVSATKDLAGADLPNSPDLKLYTSARYERDTSWGLMFGQLSYSWQDEVQYSLSQNPNTVQDSYGILNGSIGVTLPGGNWNISLYGRNLLDENYVTNIFQDFITGYSTNILHYRPKYADRTFGVVVRARF